MSKWLKLDNAAKIFPSVSTRRGTNLFSLSFVMKDEVNPTILEEALSVALERFPYFNVRIKRGIFWFYLEENKKKVMVYKENPFLLVPVNSIDTRGFLFRLTYFRKKITLEVFHAMTDGTGALQFLKAIVYAYIRMTGEHIVSEDKILTDIETLKEEYEDSFVKNYDKTFKNKRVEKTAVHFKGTFYNDNWLSVITGIAPTYQMKQLQNKYNCSTTQLLASAIMYSATKTRSLLVNRDKPFQIFVPVNLRNFFTSVTLRNFSLYVRTAIDINKDYTLEEIIKIVKEDLTNELQEDKMKARITSNVKIERMFIMRIVPLFIKEIAFKIGYSVIGTRPNSYSLSNLGKVDLPQDMVPYVEQILFSNGASYTTPINMGVTIYNGKIYMTITSTIVERDFQKEFFRLLSSLGLDIVLETNDLEV